MAEQAATERVCRAAEQPRSARQAATKRTLDTIAANARRVFAGISDVLERS